MDQEIISWTAWFSQADRPWLIRGRSSWLEQLSLPYWFGVLRRYLNSRSRWARRNTNSKQPAKEN